MKRFTPILFVVLALMVLPGAAYGAPGWLAVTPVTGPVSVGSGQIAYDAQGNATAAYAKGLNRPVVSASTRPVGSTSWSAPVQLSNSATLIAWEPSLAVDPAGNAVVAWVLSDASSNATVQIATRAPGGSWSAPQTVEAPSFAGANAWNVRVARDAAGSTVLAWIRKLQPNAMSEVHVATATAGGALSAPTVLDTGAYASELALATNAAGDTVLAWNRMQPSGAGTYVAALRPAGAGGFGAPQNLINVTSAGHYLGSAIDDAGRATVAGDAGPGGALFVWSATRPAGSAAFNPATTQSQAHQPSLRGNPRGDTSLAWTAFDGTIRLADRPAAGAAFTETYSVPGRWVSVARAVNGATLLGYSVLNPAGTAWLSRAAYRTPTGTTFKTTPLSSTGDSIARVSFDSHGDGTAIWTVPNNLYTRVLDASGPDLSNVVQPATGTVGQPVGFSATANDRWSQITLLQWTFGDGTSATGSQATHTYANPGTFAVTFTAKDKWGNKTTAKRKIKIAAA